MHNVGASPTAGGESFAVPPGSATVGISGAAAAQSRVLEMQILGDAGPSLNLEAAALGRCSSSLKGMLSYSPASALLQYTGGRKVEELAL